MIGFLGEEKILEEWRRLREENPAITPSETAEILGSRVPPGFALRYAQEHGLAPHRHRSSQDELVAAGQSAVVMEMLQDAGVPALPPSRLHASTRERAGTVSSPRQVVIPGAPGKRTYRVGPVDLDQLGLYPQPDHPEQLLLKDGADPDVACHFPNGIVFTASMFPLLASHALDAYNQGWEIDTQDPGRLPTSELPS